MKRQILLSQSGEENFFTPNGSGEENPSPQMGENRSEMTYDVPFTLKKANLVWAWKLSWVEKGESLEGKLSRNTRNIC